MNMLLILASCIDSGSRPLEDSKLRLRIALLLLAALYLAAQDAPQLSSTSSDWLTDHVWLSGQTNFIRQSHGAFPALYSGPNSLSPDKEHATSRVLTLYTGLRLTSRLEILFDVESAGGDGLSHALGVAGFPNLDVVPQPNVRIRAVRGSSDAPLHFTAQPRNDRGYPKSAFPRHHGAGAPAGISSRQDEHGRFL